MWMCDADIECTLRRYVPQLLEYVTRPDRLRCADTEIVFFLFLNVLAPLQPWLPVTGEFHG